MKAWFITNWRTVSAITALVALYLLAKYAPMANDERELIIAVCKVLDLLAIGSVPAFARIERKDQP